VAYDRLVDLPAISGQLAAAYVRQAVTVQKLTPKEASAMRGSYAKVFEAQERKALSDGILDDSFFDGDVSSVKAASGKQVTVVLLGGGVGLGRAFSAKPVKGGYRFAGLANADELVKWMSK